MICSHSLGRTGSLSGTIGTRLRWTNNKTSIILFITDIFPIQAYTCLETKKFYPFSSDPHFPACHKQFAQYLVSISLYHKQTRSKHKWHGVINRWWLAIKKRNKPALYTNKTTNIPYFCKVSQSNHTYIQRHNELLRPCKGNHD